MYPDKKQIGRVLKMKALSLNNPSITREELLKMSEEIPGAWIGIRIAAYMLILSGWRSSQVAELFGLTRWTVVKWIQKANQKGIGAVMDAPRPGRPSQFEEGLRKALEGALSRSPKEFGISRVRWDGIVVAEYLRRLHGIKICVRHAQRWLHKMGYSLRQPIYRFAQASKEGVEEFHKELKKTSDSQKKRRKTGDSV